MVELPEHPGVENRTVLFAAAGIVGFLVVILAVLSALFPNLIHRPLPARAQFPDPSVMTDERAQRINLERAQNQRLNGRNGAMPIDRAMASATPRSSASAPGDAPGVSTNVTTGSPNRSASSINRMALR